MEKTVNAFLPIIVFQKKYSLQKKRGGGGIDL
jgi:hypothetical protein